MSLFSRQIYPLEPPAFGLDIGERSVRVVQLERSGKDIQLLAYGEQQIPTGVIEDGQIKQPAVVAAVVQEVLKRTHGASIRTSYVVAALPEQGVFVNVFALPEGTNKDVGQTIRWELEGNIPLSPDEVFFDWQFVEQGKRRLDHQDVLVVASPRALVNQYVDVLQELKLKPKALEVESIATARAVLPSGEANKPTLMLDLGAARTGFAVVSGQAVRFTTAIPVSGISLTAAIAKELGVTEEEAEKIKNTFGLDRKKAEGRLFKAQLPQLQTLIQQLRKYLEFYRTHNLHEHGSSRGIQKLFLSGGGANLKGLAAHLSIELKLPVEIGNPWTNILKPPYRNLPDLPFNESLSYTTALGLALRGLRG